MELNLFVYVLLTFCIPYLSYSNFRIKPRKGFSILFISIISTIILLNFSLLTVLGTLLLIATLLIKNKKIYGFDVFGNFPRQQIDEDNMFAKNHDKQIGKGYTVSF